MNDRVELLHPAACGVGESIVWSEADRALLWVDITGRALHRLEPGSGRTERWDLPEFVTSVGLAASGGVVLGLVRRVCTFDFERLETLAAVEPEGSANRLNEGRVGPDGAFWVGTMENNLNEDGSPRELGEPAGTLHRVDASGNVERLVEHAFGISNTMLWDADRFITADTLTDELYAYEYDAASGALGARRTFAAGFGRGAPDGSCLDADGYVWNARFGGSCLVRFAPDGAVDRVLELPCTNPTSCTFGGPDLDTLYVTSARFELDATRIRQEPAEGGVFACDVGVAGRPEHLFRG